MPNSSYLKSYLNILIARGKLEMAESIKKTAEEFKKDNLDTFSFADHEVGLLFGNVQAGKTAQMFGILCAAADESFPIFVLLTTDNIALQNQTLDRVYGDLDNCGFCICGELDKQKFVDNALEKPAIIVLKKNSKVLLQWYNTLASSSFVIGNAIFIIDDEADAASPNTLINRNRVSTINRRLANIKDYSIGSIYLQVTGTPQALLLQSSISNFRPKFTCYFEPGKSYLGGDFFFGNDNNECIQFISDGDDDNNDDLLNAIVCHLLSSAVLLLSGEKVCNCIIHPGIRRQSHQAMKNNVISKLDELSSGINSFLIKTRFFINYSRMNPEKVDKPDFEIVYECVKKLLFNKSIKVMIMNGDTNITDEEYSCDSNIIIGGNVLGRGVTFPKLQTIYYTRTAKKPQADTMWQHSRMFGYDRDPGLMRVFITRPLFKLFSDINAANNSIISQVEKGIEKIQLVYPEGISPTRRNVIDLKMVDFVAGGANYYPDNPSNNTVEEISNLLSDFGSTGYYQVGAKFLLEILGHIIPSDDFNKTAFENALKARLAERPVEQAILVVRRGREVTQGTGSLLSPNDRAIGDQFPSKFVLTMYQISGEHGWKQDNIWVPNIKLPEFLNYYDVH